MTAADNTPKTIRYGLDEEGMYQKAVDLPSSFRSHLEGVSRKFLYHYTSQEGLIGIISTSELWATKVQYMNDSSEFGLALKIAADCLNTRLTNCDAKQKRKLDLLIQTLNIGNANVFVSCFCEEGDLLGQWRAYTGANHGYSIGIDSKILNERAGASKFTLGPCVYDAKSQMTIIEEAIEKCLSLTEEECDTTFEYNLITIGAFFKDAQFQEEREWRLVSRATSITHAKVGFRAGQSMISPYLRVALGEKDTSSISHIIVGPCPHPDLSKKSVEMLLRNARIVEKAADGDENVDVKNSKIPYRNW